MNVFFIYYRLQNGDGFISAKELGVLMRAMGRNPTEDEIMQIMNEIDVDHNGNKNWILYMHCIVLIVLTHHNIFL